MIQRSELRDRALDRSALRAAALYHDVGWALQVSQGDIEPAEVLLRPPCDLLRVLASDWMRQRLVDVLAKSSLDNACRFVEAMNDRDSPQLEAQLLAEADNLDDIGAQAVVLMVRKQLVEGKTLEETLQAWQRQEEYQYWQARINKGFRFDFTRQLAERRYQELRCFMTSLSRACRVAEGSRQESGDRRQRTEDRSQETNSPHSDF